jgi:hypothetical protein
MSRWFRSEPMEYISFIVNEDAAHECLADLGKMGVIQFTDVSLSLSLFISSLSLFYCLYFYCLYFWLNFFVGGERERNKTTATATFISFPRCCCVETLNPNVLTLPSHLVFATISYDCYFCS